MMWRLSWIQVYDPLNGPWLSTAVAALPIVLLLVALGVLEWRAHRAALLGLVVGTRRLDRRVRDAGRHGGGDGSVRGRLRTAADRLDRAGGGLSL